MDREVFSLAWPSLLSEISTPLLGAVDTLVVGHLADVADLGGVALATAVFNPMLFVFNFLRMGTSGVTAKAFGAEDAREILATLLRSAIIALVIGACLCLLQRPLAFLGFGFVHPPDAATMDRALTYFRARILGVPAALVNFAACAWLNAVKHPKNLLAVTMVLNLSNAVLCVVLAWVLDFGVAGVGYATALANYIGLAFAISRIYVIYPQLQCVIDAPVDQKTVGWSVILDRTKVWELLAVQGNVFLRSLFLMYITTDFTRYSAALGSVPLAANNLLMQMQMLISYGADGFANAAEALVGKATGMGDVDLVREVVASLVRWSALVIAAFTAAFMLLGGEILECLTSHSGIVSYAVDYLPWQWAAPAASVAAYLLDGVFVGANCFRDMRDANFLGMLAFVGLLRCLSRSSSSLWTAYLAHLLVRAAALLWRFPRLEEEVLRHSRPGREALLAADGGRP